MVFGSRQPLGSGDFMGTFQLPRQRIGPGQYLSQTLFITYINTGCFCFYLIPYLHRRHLSPRQFYRELRTPSPPSPPPSYGSNTSLSLLNPDIDLDIGVRETIRLSLQFVVLWFTANYVMNSSLSYTSVASQTILLSTSSFFTLIIGYFYSIEKVNRNKIAGLVLSFAGVVIVTEIDASSTNSRASPKWVVWGNTLALLGAVIYGAYTTLLKKKITIHNSQLERNLDTHLFFAFVGIFCLLLLWPVLLILHLTGLESFALPHTRQVTTVLLINAAITFVSDLCWCKAVLLTSPLTVTVGLSMTIPLAMIGDWILEDISLNIWYLFGAVIVMVGFFIINRDEKRDSELDQGQ